MSRPPVAVGRVRPRAAVSALGVLWRFKVPEPLVVVAGGLAGLLLY